MTRQKREPSYVSPTPPDEPAKDEKLQEVEKQRRWANKIHDGDAQREIRTRGKGKPSPNKRKAKS
jgi:hypothetical protein